MAESNVAVTPGAGKNLHTWARVVGATTVEDEFVIPGEYPLATYVGQSAASSIATANDHVQLMAGGALNVRIRRIRVEQAGLATAAAIAAFGVYRLSTAGTGGGVVTPRPLDSADAACGATMMTLPTVKGTEAVNELFRRRMVLTQTVATAGGALGAWEWVAAPGSKGILIPAGAANGIAIKNLAAYAGASIDVSIDFVETSFAG
jgi:hypothetical protein